MKPMKHEQFQELKDEFYFECKSEFAKKMEEMETEALENAKQIDDRDEALEYIAHTLTYIASTQSFEAAVRYCDKVVDTLFEAVFE